MADKKIVKKAKTTKKKVKRGITSGMAFVQASFNNTLVTITDNDGNAITQSSAGALGYKGSRKSTPFAAQQAAAAAAKVAKDQGVQSVKVLIKGAGNGRESAIRAFGEEGINVTEIKDVSPIPHNGCRPPKKRRI